jgi:hypothetical protein
MADMTQRGPQVNRRSVLGATALAAGGVVGSQWLGAADWGSPRAFASPTELLETNLGWASAGLNFNNGILIGRELWLAASLMEPLNVVCYDFDQQRVTKVVEVPGVVGLWGVDHIGTDLYVGSFTPGKIFRIDTVAATVVDEVPLGEEVVWNVKASPDGQVFAGTYPSAELWQYDPSTGSATNHGRMSDETYVRDLAVNETTVYCGIGAQPALIAFDRATGEKTDVFPDELRGIGLAFVSTMQMSGKYLLAGTTPLAHVIVMNTEDHDDYTIIKIPNNEPFVVGLYGSGEDIYIGTTRSNIVWHSTIGSTEVTPIDAGDYGAMRMGHLDENTLWIAQGDGASTLDLTTGQRQSVMIQSELVQPSPQPPQSLHWADGRIFVGGTGFMSIHDELGRVERRGIRTAGAVKDLTSGGGLLYTGHYTLCGFGVMPTDGDELEVVAKIDPSYQQTRPINMAMDAAAGRVLMASEPDYGAWEGALSWLDIRTHEVTTRRGILQDQSVAAVTPGRHGAFVAGSVINGYGTTPTRATAQVGFFHYNADKVIKVAENLPATTSVIELHLHGDLLLAHLREGLMVGLHAQSLETLWTLQVGSRGGRSHAIGDTLYGTDGNILWALDLAGRRKPGHRVLTEGLDGKFRVQPTVTGDGVSTLFTLRGNDLIRLDLR